MKQLLTTMTALMLLSPFAWAQEDFAPVLLQYNHDLVPYIDLEEAKALRADSEVFFLDTRSRKEFDVSHIPGAHFIGEGNITKDLIQSIAGAKAAMLIVYCSIGVRSEKSGAQIQDLGYTVRNLYGGIFHWKNNQNPLVNNQQLSTDSIHAFSKRWGIYLADGIKIYD